jgi:hypothetical protein
MLRRHYLSFMAGLASAAPQTVFDWRGLAHTLSKHVLDDGRIHYGNLKQDLAPLKKVVEALADYDGTRLVSREAKLAHWLNVYNTLVLYSMAEEYPEQKGRLGNPLKRASYFYRRKFKIGGQERSLADIEDKSIRSLKDPRIHFAIFSGNRSCAWLSRKVYEPATLDNQLESATTHFLSQARNVSLDKVRRQATVSELFKWFRKDFGGSDESVLRFLAKRLPGQAINPTSWKLDYFDWDWSLNDVT